MKTIKGVQRGQSNPGKPVIPPEVVGPEFRRLMQNWAVWRSGASISMAVSGAYNVELHEAAYEQPYPLMNGDAVDVEEAVQALPGELRVVVETYWLARGTTEQKARDSKCAVRTYWRRLGHGHVRIEAYLRQRRERRRKAA